MYGAQRKLLKGKKSWGQEVAKVGEVRDRRKVEVVEWRKDMGGREKQWDRGVEVVCGAWEDAEA